MDREEWGAWLRLLLTPHIGPVKARALLRAFGSPQSIWQADATAWRTVVGAKECESLGRMPLDWAEQVALTQAWLDGAPAAEDGEGGRHLLALGDPRYPRQLLESVDPPLMLFAHGRLSRLQCVGVAMVGSRHPTAQGEDNARAFAQALSAGGVCVVSGLALGIDAAAHEGALRAQDAAPGQAGSTIAVVGTGLDRVYPRAHMGLAHRVAAEGLLLSEFVLGTGPLAAHFPKRNRIVAGLSQATLVVEAAVQSGSLITARQALDMGREVMAIPGSIHAPQARGCHALIRQGAKLVETAQDVFDELHLSVTVAVTGDATDGASEAASTDGDDPVLRAMGFDLIGQDALSARTGLGAAQLGARLLELELEGRVARLPGQLFQRLASA